jgi:drug/metabolite transporter (DMT)-like permease
VAEAGGTGIGVAPRGLVGAAAVAAMCLIWGSTWLVIREGLRDLPPFTSAGVRFVVAGAAMTLIAPLVRRLEGGRPPPAWLWIVVGLTNFATSFGIVYWCETRLPSGLVSVLWSVFPLLMAVAGHFLLPGERLRVVHAAGFVSGFAGVALLFATDLGTLGAGARLAAALLLVSPVVSTVGTALIKRFGRDVSGSLLNRNAMLLGALVLLLLAVLVERRAPVRWSARALLSVGYLALVGTCTTFTLYFWMLRHVAASRMSLISYVVPAVALGLGWLFGGEPVRAHTLAGAALIVGGVALALQRAPRPDASDAAARRAR